MDLLGLKLVCIIEAIPLAAALFWDPIFALCPSHTMKLAFKLGLRINKVKNDVVKEKIETIWANRTVSLLNRLFMNNPEWWTTTIIIYTQSATRSWALCWWFRFIKIIYRWYPEYNLFYFYEISRVCSLVFLVYLINKK